MDVGQRREGDGLIIGCVELKPDGAEVQAMGIDAKVLGSRLLTASQLILHGINFWVVAMRELEGALGIGGTKPERVRKAVPSPIGHSGEGHALGIVLWIGLHARHIDSGGDVAIPHGQRSQRIGSGDNGVVALHHGFAVDGMEDGLDVVAQLLHLQRSPNEGANAFGIVVADGFGEVIGEGAVSMFVLLHIGSRFQHTRTDSRTEACH